MTSVVREAIASLDSVNQISPRIRTSRNNTLSKREVFIRHFSFPFMGEPMDFAGMSIDVSPRHARLGQMINIGMKISAYLGLTLLTTVFCCYYKCCCAVVQNYTTNDPYEKKIMRLTCVINSIGLGILFLIPDIIGTIMKVHDRSKTQPKTSRPGAPLDPTLFV